MKKSIALISIFLMFVLLCSCGQNNKTPETTEPESEEMNMVNPMVESDPETFYPEIADIWAESINTAEMAGMASVNLFQHLPYALEKAFQWMASDQLYVQVCGYHTIIHLTS